MMNDLPIKTRAPKADHHVVRYKLKRQRKGITVAVCRLTTDKQFDEANRKQKTHVDK